MKTALLAIALTAAAAAAPIGVAQAHGGVAIRVDAPGFGIRIGAPLPVHAPPLYLPAPAYAPAVPVAYPPPVAVIHAPPHARVGQPFAYPVVVPYGYVPAARHWKHAYPGARRVIVAVGHPHVVRY